MCILNFSLHIDKCFLVVTNSILSKQILHDSKDLKSMNKYFFIRLYYVQLGTRGCKNSGGQCQLFMVNHVAIRY